MKTKFSFTSIIAALLLDFLRMSLQSIRMYQIPISRKVGLATLLSIGISIFYVQAKAQHVNYWYDANGNRTSRTYSPMFTMNNTAQNDTEAVKAATQYGIGVYPNPLMDGSNVTVVISPPKQDKAGEEPAPIDAEATVYVLDNTGKVLFSKQQNTSSPSQLDLSGYSAGIYYIKVAIGKEILFYKITKAK